MAVVLDGTLGIQRNAAGEIENIIWFLYGLPTDAGRPGNVVFLNESFGKSSPQMLAFEIDGEEYVAYADWDVLAEPGKAREIRRFYREYGHVLISAPRETTGPDEKLRCREWLIPIRYFEDYSAMAKEMAAAG